MSETGEAAVERALERIEARGIGPDEYEFQMLLGVREALGAYVGAPPDDLALVLNATAGMNASAKE